MKLRCVTTQGKGLLFKDSSEGLTKDKTYSGFAIQNSTTNYIQDENARFLIYNDHNEWKSYHPYFFVPVE
jgi:hypothetical protein